MNITNNKKINRIDRLSDYREVGLPYGINSTNMFQIEVSTKAFRALKNLKEVSFNVCHDFDTDLYWLVVNGEGSDKKFDFTYLIQGNMNTRSNGWNVDKDICISFTHIDVATTTGLLEATMELLAEWLDKKYGEDCGFKRKINYKKLDYAVSKIEDQKEVIE